MSIFCTDNYVAKSLKFIVVRKYFLCVKTEQGMAFA